MSFRLTKAISLGAAYTGLTLKAQLVNADGTNNGGAVTTGFSARGNGMYLWDYASYPDSFRGIVEIRNNADDTLLAIDEVNPEEINVTGSGALTAAERNAIADAIIARNEEGGSSSGRTIKHVLAFIRNKKVVTPLTATTGLLTVYAADDVTPLWTAVVGREAVNPITSVDPA